MTYPNVRVAPDSEVRPVVFSPARLHRTVRPGPESPDRYDLSLAELVARILRGASPVDPSEFR